MTGGTVTSYALAQDLIPERIRAIFANNAVKRQCSTAQLLRAWELESEYEALVKKRRISRSAAASYSKHLSVMRQMTSKIEFHLRGCSLQH